VVAVVAALAVVVVAVVAALAVVLLGRGNGPANGSSPSVGGTSANTSGWQTYHDPMNMYSLRLPPGWTAKVGTSSGFASNRGGAISVTMETVVFSDPRYGQSSAQVDISAEPIDSDVARRVYCADWSPHNFNDTFHGIPAEHIPEATWLFSSANAHFQLDVWIPGVLEPPHERGPLTGMEPTASPLPASWIAADRVNINGVLASFRPANPAPLSCG
jgi:hypothetical protein